MERWLVDMERIVRVYTVIVAAGLFMSAVANAADSRVHLDPLEWEIELEYDGWSQQIEGAGETQVEQYSEKFEVSQSGYVISPKLFDFSVNLTPTLLQGRREGRVDERTDGTVFDYDVELGALRGVRLPVALAVGASSSTSDFSNGISGRAQQTKSDQFAALDVKFRPFPMRLTYSNQLLDQTFTSGQSATPRNREEFQRLVRWQGRSSKLATQVEKRWFDDRVGENDYDSLEQSVTHEFFWGKNSRLATRQRYFSREGSNPYTLFAFSEGLHLQHLKNLSSALDYDYMAITHTDDTRGHTGRYALTYRPTEKLGLGFSAEGRTHESPAGSYDDYGGGLDLSYYKDVFWNGRLILNLDESLIRTDRQSNGATFESVDVSFTVPATLLVLLNVTEINSGSILVTDSSNYQVFFEGVDYIVRALSGGRTELQILTSGQIAAGDTILVSYTAVAQPSAQYRTGLVHVNLSINYKSVRFYHSSHFSNVILETGSLGQGQDDVREQKTGVELKLDKEWFEATARAETLSYQSGEFSRGSLSFTETARVEISAGTYLDLSANQISYENDGRETDVSQWNANLTWAPLGGMIVKPHIKGWDRREDLGQFEERLIAGLDLTWKLRKFDLKVDFSIEEQKTETLDRSDQRVNIRIVRRSR